MATRPKGVYGDTVNDTKNRLFINDIGYPEFVALDGHELVVDDVSEIDPYEFETVIWNDVRKEFDPYKVTLREAQTDGVTFTITIPAYEYSRLKEIAEGGDARDVFVLKDNDDYLSKKATVYRTDGAFARPRREASLTIKSFEDLDTPVGETTTGSAPTWGEMYPLQALEVNTLATSAFYACLWSDQDTGYLGDGYSPKDAIIAGLSTNAYLGVASSSSSELSNRFNTLTAISNSIGAGNIITSLVQSGSVIVGTWTDDLNPATATDGGTFVYQNGTVTLGTSITTGMYGCSAIDETFYFVGAGGAIYTATRIDPATLTQITQAVTTEDLMCIAADADKGIQYIGANNGEAYTLVASNVSDISAFLPGSPSAIVSVAVLDEDHVAFGGASGYFAEHRQASRASASNTYVESTIGSGTVYAIAGDSLRILASSDEELYERSLLSMNQARMEWRELELDGGAPSGNIRDISMLKRYQECNYAVAVTDTAEVIYVKPELATR